MKNAFLLSFASILLAACSASDNGVRVAKDKPKATVAPVAPVAARTEPIFYNGQTYTMKFAPSGAGYDVAVLGMNAKQQRDAVNIATSAIRYFTCPEGKTGTLTNSPRYVDGSWKMSARCA